MSLKRPLLSRRVSRSTGRRWLERGEGRAVLEFTRESLKKGEAPKEVQVASPPFPFPERSQVEEGVFAIGAEAPPRRPRPSVATPNSDPGPV